MNILHGTLISSHLSEHLCMLNVAVMDDRFELILAETPDLHPGEPVEIAFKETEIIVAHPSHTESSSNAYKAIVHSIDTGTILTSITLDYQRYQIVSLITTSAFIRLNLSVGDLVMWMIQPSEISFMRGN